MKTIRLIDYLGKIEKGLNTINHNKIQRNLSEIIYYAKAMGDDIAIIFDSSTNGLTLTITENVRFSNSGNTVYKTHAKYISHLRQNVVNFRRCLEKDNYMYDNHEKSSSEYRYNLRQIIILLTEHIEDEEYLSKHLMFNKIVKQVDFSNGKLTITLLTHEGNTFTLNGPIVYLIHTFVTIIDKLNDLDNLYKGKFNFE